MTLAELDIFFRGVAIGGLLVVLSAFVRELRQTPAVGYGIAFIASVIAYLAASFPGDLGDFSFLRFAAFPLAAAAMPLFWMFSRAWYDDDFRPGWREYGVACFVVTLTILHEFVFPGFGRTLVGRELSDLPDQRFRLCGRRLAEGLGPPGG